ncbi:MAG: hypothetical protein PHV20_01395 [Bacteroidales bacterium]|nr:hypothetical protein [Bacteroidales bacterium]
MKKRKVQVFVCNSSICNFYILLLVSIIVNLIIINDIDAQQLNNRTISYDLPIIKTPDASSFMKFIDNQVNLFNGSIDISIPIYTIEDGSVKIPISMRYNTTGVKVNEEASWVGLGWNLNVGGMITQIVEGKLDVNTDYWNTVANYLKSQTSILDYYATTNSVSLANPGTPPGGLCFTLNLQSSIPNLAENGNLRPDTYYYNFLNYSGKFYIDPADQKVHPLDEGCNIKFEKMSNGIDWKATDPDGNIFLFTKSTTISNETNPYIMTSRNSHLTQILTHDGMPVILSYRTDASKRFDFLTASMYRGRESIINGYSPKMIKSTYEIATIDQIRTPNFIVRFNVNDFAIERREDLPNERKLQSIEIENSETGEKKNFEFKYNYNTSPLNGTYYINNDVDFNINKQSKRLILKSLGEVGLPAYSFEYESGLPVKTSYAIDYWGYYNGEITNNTIIPNLKNVGVNFADFPVPEYSIGANRAPSQIFSKAGLLNKITYPTGGIRVIEYEPNTFNNERHLSTEQLKKIEFDMTNAVRVNDQNSLNDQTSYQFYINQPTRVKIVGQINRGVGTYADIQDAYIELRRFTTLIKRWDLSGQYNQNILDIDFETELEPSSENYSISVHINDNLGPQDFASSKHISTYSKIAFNTLFPTSFKYSYGGGLRVKRELLFDNKAITPSLIYKYDYDEGNDLTGSTTGKLMTPLKFHHILYNNHFINGFIGQPTCTTYVFVFHDDYEIVSSNKYPENSYSVGSTVGYNSVTIHKEGDSNWFNGGSSYPQGKTVYNFHNQVTDVYHMNDYALGAPLWDQPLNGKTREKIDYDINNSLLHKVLYEYSYIKNPYGSMIFGSVYINHKMYNPFTDLPNDCDMLEPARLGNAYGEGCLYTIPTHIIQLEKYTIVNPNNIVEEHYYKYNQIGQIIKDSMINSDGRQSLTLNKYPYDLAANNTDCYSMKQYNILSPLIEKEIKIDLKTTYKEKNTIQVSRFFTNIFNNNEQIPLFSLFKKEIAPSGLNFTHTLSYEYDKKLSQFSDDSGLKTSFIWSYNETQPIIKVQNVDYITLKNTVNSIQSNIQSFMINSVGNLTTSAQRNNWSTFNQTLRLNLPPNALVETFTYNPLLGITSSTNSRGITTYYEYDIYGRLVTKKDNNLKLLQKIDYNYNH